MEFEAAQQRWRYEVGRLILAFGEIEFGICQCLVHIPATNQWEALKNEDLKVKANAAIEHTQASNLASSTKQRLIHALNSAMQMAKDRNLIAHNPLHLGIFTSEAGGVDFRLQVFSLRNPSIIMTIDQLSAVAERATAVALELIVLAGEAA